MKSKGSKFKWRGFYEASPYYVKKVMHVELASLQHRNVIEIEPLSDSCFFNVALMVAPRTTPPQKQKKHFLHFLGGSQRVGDTEQDLLERIVNILVDTDNDKWVYTKGSTHGLIVVNWPPRYKFTISDKEIIYQAISKYVNKVCKSQSHA